MPKASRILEFDEKAPVVEESIRRFRSALEVEQRGGWFGLKALLSKDLPLDQRQKLELAGRVVGHLGMDMKSKAHIRGRVDLSGFQQKGKLRRTLKSRAGNTKSYYRDYWFSCRLRTVDGCELKLTIGEDVKHKKGVATRKSRLDLKLIPVARVYEVRQPDAGILDRAYPVSLEAMLAKPEGIHISGLAGPKGFGVGDVMRVIREAYSCLALRRVAQTA